MTFTDGLLLIIMLLLFIVLALTLAAFSALRAQSAAAAEPGMPMTVGGYEDGFEDRFEDGFEDGFEDKDAVFDVTGGYPGYYMPIREPWFDMMLNGKKLVEARLNRGPATSLKAGDQITVARSRPKGDATEHPGARRFVTKVKRVKHYKSLEDMVKEEGAEALFPGLTGGVKAVVAHYREFSAEADEIELLKTASHAFVAIEIVPLTAEEKKQAMSAAHKPSAPKAVKSKYKRSMYE